jgi:hypothetical protein
MLKEKRSWKETLSVAFFDGCRQKNSPKYVVERHK